MGSARQGLFLWTRAVFDGQNSVGSVSGWRSRDVSLENSGELSVDRVHWRETERSDPGLEAREIPSAVERQLPRPGDRWRTAREPEASEDRRDDSWLGDGGGEDAAACGLSPLRK